VASNQSGQSPIGKLSFEIRQVWLRKLFISPKIKRRYSCGHVLQSCFMKVAIVLNTSWNIYNFRMNFIKSLMDHGHEIHTIAPFDHYTFHLIKAGCIHHNVKMDSRGANLIKDLALTAELGALYYKIKPDVVLHFTIKPNVYGTLAAAALRIPVINNVCGLGTVFLKEGIVSWVAKMLYKISFRFPKKVFFQNPEDKQLFIDKKLVSPKIADLLPGSGINVADFTPAPIKNQVFTFLFISRLIYDKGIVEYFEAIKVLREYGINARFQLLGAKDPKHKRGLPVHVINTWVKEGYIEYLGKADDVRPYINQADCIVLPSYREGSPRSLMEAACMAKPIVATDVPGCRQVVEHGFNGLLCQLQDAGDLAAKMLMMIKIPSAIRQQMGERGRTKMETEFSDTLVANKYLNAIHELSNQVHLSPSYLKEAS
jgi:glycosyltransferase involved in cell wall biosynthesis